MWLLLFDIGKGVGQIILGTLSLPSNTIFKSFTFGDDDFEFGTHGIAGDDDDAYEDGRSNNSWYKSAGAA